MSGAYYKLANQERENHVRMFYVWKRTLLENGGAMMKKWLNFFLVSQSRSVSLPNSFSNFLRFFFQKYFWTWMKFDEKKILVRELNEPLKCQICSGYLINPTVVNECQHTFCKTVSKEDARSVTSLFYQIKYFLVHFNPLWRRAWLSSLWDCFSPDHSRKIYNKRWNFTTGKMP